MIELTTPVGRLVTGHPMVAVPKKDALGKPKMQKDGVTPLISFYSGLAVVKTPGHTHWNQTEWGAKIWNEGLAAFPNGETQTPTFAWKIEDGDSTIPNKKGKVPCQREGWAGHWILHLSDGFPFSCYHDGKFNPYESIQNKDEIKTGDYGQFIIQVQGNNLDGRKETDGVYLNPKAFSLVRAGVRIVSANEVDAVTGFGNSDRTLPANAQIDTAVAPSPGAVSPSPGAVAPSPGAVAPAPDILIPPDPTVNVKGEFYKISALKAAGWTDDQIKPYLS